MLEGKTIAYRRQFADNGHSNVLRSNGAVKLSESQMFDDRRSRTPKLHPEIGRQASRDLAEKSMAPRC